MPNRPTPRQRTLWGALLVLAGMLLSPGLATACSTDTVSAPNSESTASCCSVKPRRDCGCCPPRGPEHPTTVVASAVQATMHRAATFRPIQDQDQERAGERRQQQVNVNAPSSCHCQLDQPGSPARTPDSNSRTEGPSRGDQLNGLSALARPPYLVGPGHDVRPVWLTPSIAHTPLYLRTSRILI